jgi:hypothetical protein
MKHILPFLLFLGVFSFAITYGKDNMVRKSGDMTGIAKTHADLKPISGEPKNQSYVYSSEFLIKDFSENSSWVVPDGKQILGAGGIQGTIISYYPFTPLAGVMVKAGDTVTMTNDSGYYSLNLIEGQYEVEFLRPGYDTLVVPLTVIADSIVFYDDTLHHYPYRPACAYAEVINNDSGCLVTWCKPAGPQLLLYDDGNADSYVQWDSLCRIKAVRFTPDTYPATVTGGQFFFWGVPGFGQPFTAVVYADDGTGGLPGTLLDSVSFIAGPMPGWVTINGLNAVISSGDFYLGILFQCDSLNCLSLGVDETDPDAGKSYSRNVTAGEPWMLSSVQDFMIRAIVDEPVEQYSGKALALNNRTGIARLTSTVDENTTPVHETVASESYIHYLLYRFTNIDPLIGPYSGSIAVLTGDITDTTYLSGGTSWVCIAPGWVVFAVQAIYNDGLESEMRFTEPVAHNLYADVSITVLSGCDTLPLQGATVTLSGGEYPFDTLVQQTGEGGIASFPDIIKGIYEINISGTGFATYSDSYNIQEDFTTEVMLQVNPAKPENLSVDGVTLLATWEPPQTDQAGGISDTSALQGYAVYLDGSLLGQTQELYWDFSPYCLNFGQSYTAAVAGVYCTGIGEADTFAFVSNFLPPPQNLTASTTSSVGYGTVTFSWEMPDTTCTTCTPVSFFIYSYGYQIAEIPAENLSYTITDYSPTEECLALSAKYDLNCIGSPGVFAESAKTEELCVDVTLGLDIPFEEDWSSGQFETNLWSPGLNWVIEGTGDSPSPAARFVSEPNLTGYASSLQSHWINALLTDTVMPYDIYLYYDLKLQNAIASSTEKLAVEVFGPDGWTRVKEYVNSGSFDLSQERLLISQQAKNRIFMIRFLAEGDNTTHIAWWETDNIMVKAELSGVEPTGLTASPYGSQGDDVLLQWQPPASDSYVTKKQEGNSGFFDPGSSEEIKPSSQAELLGYNVYRRAFYSPEPGSGSGSGLWSLVATTGSADTLYVDLDPVSPETNCFEYYVTSLFGQGESSPSNTDDQCFYVGVKENASAGAAIYPNPATEWVHIVLPQHCEVARIVNTLGTELKRFDTSGRSELLINVKNYLPGTYFVQFIQSNSGQMVMKLVVRR